MGGIFGITGGSRFAFDVYGDLFFESPPNLVITEGDTQASFAFDVPTRIGQNTITGYEVEVSGETPNETGASSPIVYTGLTNEQVYQGRVRATGTPHNSEWSTFQFFTPTASTTHKILAESGDAILAESGDFILQESG